MIERFKTKDKDAARRFFSGTSTMEYKGIAIKYSKLSKQYTFNLASGVMYKDNLDDAMTSIDGFIRRQSALDVPVLMHWLAPKTGHTFRSGKITSVAKYNFRAKAHGADSEECASYDLKRRIIKDTPENVERTKRYIELQAEVKALQEQVSAVVNTFDVYTMKDLQKMVEEKCSKSDKN